MKRNFSAVALAMALMTIGSVAFAFPAAGGGAFKVKGVVTFQIGRRQTTVRVRGSAVFRWSDPGDADEDGLTDVQTELVGLNLRGSASGLGEVLITDDSNRRSVGLIEQRRRGHDFPADSFFDVFFQMELSQRGRFTLERAIRVRAVVRSIPPKEPHKSALKASVSLVTSEGESAGSVIRFTFKLGKATKGESSIFGDVVDARGNPVSNALVTLLVGGKFFASTRTDGLGQFRFLNVPPGTHVVTAEKGRSSAAVEVKVPQGGFATVRIVLPPPFESRAASYKSRDS